MFEDPLINAFATLVITVGVVAGLLFLVKKYSPKLSNSSFSNKQIKIESKQALSSKSFLYIINVEGKRLLVGANDNSISKITELERAETKNDNQAVIIPEEIKDDLSFSNFLKQSFNKNKK